ncbi:MAG: acylneuraminate cytidylyltransferase family protein [Lachnospiraceae bacterium]|nr:acylneuraminate cytidylyltransferase family protein [Lachnospiraceae bacterium]
MKNIAVIPARSGSKGLKDKNIKDLCGKPMLAYAIEAAKESGVFDTIHVSTDSEEYADIAREHGADVPFLRTPELASDTATSRDANLFVLCEYEKHGKAFDTITTLQPTSPLRIGDDIKGAMKLFEEKKANAVVSICEADHSPLWTNHIGEDLDMTGFLRREAVNTPRQTLGKYYRLNGAIYIADVGYYRAEADLYKEKCFAYIMPKERSIDIDDAFDFFMAEAIMKGMAEGKI